MSNGSKVRVYIACSLDGFIAGPDDDLSWLPQGVDPEGTKDEGVVEFHDFLSGVGALLMGRRTFDVVSAMSPELPYGDIPILVPTTRPMKTDLETVAPVGGTISEIVERARHVAVGKDVYVDGGNLIRQVLDAGLIDELIITVVPQILGEGVSLFSGTTNRHALEFTGHYRYGEMIQLHARPVR